MDSSSHSYPIVYLRDTDGGLHSILLHRLVASSFIGDVTGMHVHHKDQDHKNPSKNNLEILTPNIHHISHSRAENNPTSKFSNDDVHEICKMLCEGISHINIALYMTEKLNKQITISSIDKISSGNNWASISSQYNLKKKSRETMNEFSKMKMIIGKLIAVDGLTIHQAADRLGIKYGTKRYLRFEKCAKRYSEYFRKRSKSLFTEE